MLAHLRQPGASLSVIPEGIAGIFLASDRSTESIFLSRRKGFIKLAIQGGAGARTLDALSLKAPNAACCTFCGPCCAQPVGVGMSSGLPTSQHAYLLT